MSSVQPAASKAEVEPAKALKDPRDSRHIECAKSACRLATPPHCGRLESCRGVPLYSRVIRAGRADAGKWRQWTHVPTLLFVTTVAPASGRVHDGVTAARKCPASPLFPRRRLRCVTRVCVRCRRAFLADLDQGGDRTLGSDTTQTPPAQQLASFIKLRGLPFASTPDKVLEFLGPDVEVLNRAEVGPGPKRADEAVIGL